MRTWAWACALLPRITAWRWPGPCLRAQPRSPKPCRASDLACACRQDRAKAGGGPGQLHHGPGHAGAGAGAHLLAGRGGPGAWGRRQRLGRGHQDDAGGGLRRAEPGPGHGRRTSRSYRWQHEVSMCNCEQVASSWSSPEMAHAQLCWYCVALFDIVRL